MSQVYNIGYLSNFKIFIVAILMYVIIYALLKKTKILGDDEKISSLIALITVIIVSFSGVLTYTVIYAINWFTIILFIFLVIFILMSFVGIKIDAIGSIFSKNSKIILIAFLLVFSVIFLKGFFAMNNTFDISNPNNDSYNINTTYNTGVDDIVENNNFFERLNIDPDMLASVLFLLVIGIFIIFIGK